MQRLYPGTVLKSTVRTMLVPVPKAVPGTRAGSGSTRAGTGQTISLGAPPLRDTELLAWCEELIGSVLAGIVSEGAAGDGATGADPGRSA